LAFNFLAQHQADYQSAAGYQPAPHLQGIRLCFDIEGEEEAQSTGAE
jgi:hypothetical protein